MTHTDPPRIAVVTPYFRCPPEKLLRCLSTVQEQTLPATHFLVADGEPVDLPPRPGLVHVVLPENIGNMGSTPRGIGAMLAFSQGFDVVAFLDADNWFEPDHLQRAVAVLERYQLHVVFAQRRIIFPDGEELLVCDPEDAPNRHVDTNCWVISRRAEFLAGVWAMYPRAFGSGEDRPPRSVARALKLKSLFLAKPTVWYESNWGGHYRLAGKEPVQPLRQPERNVIHHFDPELYRRHTGLVLPGGHDQKASPFSSRPMDEWRIAIITPYRGEATDGLERCIRSVQSQNCATTQFVIGERLPALSPDIHGSLVEWPLPGLADERGNILRGVGAVLAFQLGFDAVAFLDPECWWAADHLERQLEVMGAKSADIVLGRIGPPESANLASTATPRESIDDVANAALIANSAAFVGMRWANLPHSPSPRQDQAFLLSTALSGKVSIVSAPVLTAFRNPSQLDGYRKGQEGLGILRNRKENQETKALEQTAEEVWRNIMHSGSQNASPADRTHDI